MVTIWYRFIGVSVASAIDIHDNNLEVARIIWDSLNADPDIVMVNKRP